MSKKIYSVIKWEDDGQFPDVSVIASFESHEDAQKELKELVCEAEEEGYEGGMYDSDNAWSCVDTEEGTFLRYEISENTLHEH